MGFPLPHFRASMFHRFINQLQIARGISRAASVVDLFASGGTPISIAKSTGTFVLPRRARWVRSSTTDHQSFAFPVFPGLPRNFGHGVRASGTVVLRATKFAN